MSRRTPLKKQSVFHPSSAQLLIIVILLQTVDYQFLRAQQYLMTFGRTTILRTGHSVHHIITGDFNGDDKADFALIGENEITVRRRDTSGWQPIPIAIQRPILTAVSGHLNRDKRDDLLVILDHPPEIRSYLSSSHGKFVQVWSHHLDVPFERILLGDINSDGLQDILFYGKKQLGITVFRGYGNGTFRQDTTLFAENSFNEVLIAKVNNNDLNDIIAANWITNDLFIYTGYGRLKFSDPQVVPGSSEARLFSVARIDSDEIPDLAVEYPEEHVLKIFHGDGFGGFQLIETRDLSDEPLFFDLADLNRDGTNDLGILTSHGFLAELNNGNGNFNDNVEFAAGSDPSECVFLPDRSSGRTSVAILDTVHSSLRLLYQTEEETPPDENVSYGTGVAPGSVLALDVQHRGQTDLLVPNSQSRTVSLFLSRGDGSYNGQIALPSFIPVLFLRSVPSPNRSITLVGYSTTADSIAIIHLSPDYSSRTVTLPTLGSTDLLYVREDTATDYLHIFALEQEGHSPLRFMEYGQITPTRFIERTYTSLSQFPLVTAAMTAADNASVPDLIYAVYNKQQHQLEIDLSHGTPAEDYLFSRKLATIPMDTTPSATLWCSDVNGDHIPDIILNVREPQYILYTLLGKNDSTYTAPLPQFTGEMNIAFRDDLQRIPAPRGRREDVIINNSLTRTLQLYRFREDGLLIPVMRLMSTEGMGGFHLVNSTSEQKARLIVSDKSNGWIRILPIENFR